MAKAPRTRRRRKTDSAPSSDAYWFDEKDADGVVEFIETQIRHWQGEWAGQPFTLAPYQRKATRDIFGWKRSDGTRRYRYVYVEVPKGNGKSPWGAALALALLFWDGEAGAEIYSVAGDRRQAEIVFNDAENARSQNDHLSSVSTPLRRCLVYGTSKYEVLSADAPGKHGFRPHGVIFDELHVQPNRKLFDTLRLGMRKRRQPLFIMLTTAGVYDEDSVCWTEHCYALAVSKGDIQDPTYYAVIYAADAEDDWTDERVWEKANPNIDVTVKRDALRQDCLKAQQNPAEQTTFKQLSLNLWAYQVEGGIDMNAWNKCLPQIEPAEGAQCWLGMDLSSKLDLTSVVAIFPHDDESFTAIPAFWIPEANLEERMRRDVFDYPRFVRDKALFATPGNLIDQAAVRNYVSELGKKYSIQEICFDPWNSSQMATWLGDEDGFRLVETRQGSKTLDEPCKKLVGLIADKKFRHGLNPVFRWNAQNLVFRRNANDGWSPAKDKKGRKRIDGMSAAINALSRAKMIPVSNVDRGPKVLEWA